LNKELVKTFFSLPMAELDKKNPSQAPVDYSGDYPLGTVGNSDELRDIRASFLEELTSRGVTLSPDGLVRFGRYFNVLITQRGIEPSVAALFQDQSVRDYRLLRRGEIRTPQTKSTPRPSNRLPVLTNCRRLCQRNQGRAAKTGRSRRRSMVVSSPDMVPGFSH
jgi:hypothetical protein